MNHEFCYVHLERKEYKIYTLHFDLIYYLSKSLIF